MNAQNPRVHVDLGSQVRKGTDNALDDVTHVPRLLRRMTLTLTSSHAGAIPDSLAT